MPIRPSWKIPVVLSVLVLLTACAATDIAAQDLDVLVADAATDEIPAAVASDDALDASSVRFLGAYDGLSYFVARLATAPEHSVCLVEFELATQQVSSGCADVVPGHSDRIVTLSTNNTDSELSLVRDNADQDILEHDGWNRVAANLWARTN